MPEHVREQHRPYDRRRRNTPLPALPQAQVAEREDVPDLQDEPRPGTRAEQRRGSEPTAARRRRHRAVPGTGQAVRGTVPRRRAHGGRPSGPLRRVPGRAPAAAEEQPRKRKRTRRETPPRRTEARELRGGAPTSARRAQRPQSRRTGVASGREMAGPRTDRRRGPPRRAHVARPSVQHHERLTSPASHSRPKSPQTTAPRGAPAPTTPAGTEQHNQTGCRQHNDVEPAGHKRNAWVSRQRRPHRRHRGGDTRPPAALRAAAPQAARARNTTEHGRDGRRERVTSVKGARRAGCAAAQRPRRTERPRRPSSHAGIERRPRTTGGSR